MTDSGTQTDQILKILSGAQAGAEVSLSPGEYSLGSGQDDDIHFVDLSLKAGHVRLRVSSGKVELAGGTGSIATANGLEIAAGDSDWREVEPLDIISIGMVRFALGAPTAQWTSLADTSGFSGNTESDGREKPQKTGKRGSVASDVSKWSQIALPAIALAILTGIVVWYATQNDIIPTTDSTEDRASGKELLQNALDAFDFAGRVAVREEVDGTLIADGYVDTLVQRRAIVNAIDEIAVPVRLRVWVLGVIENDIANLTRDRGIDVGHELDRDGNLVLTGTILNKARADSFFRLLKDQVLGLNSIDNRIRTAEVFLEEVKALAELSQIENTVTFRIDGAVIEANGAMLAEKIDLWVGFLQTYASKFAQRMPLRSFVQLLNEDGRLASKPGNGNGGDAILVGTSGGSGNDVVLDINKLREGQYEFGDIFVGAPTGPQTQTADLPTPETDVDDQPVLKVNTIANLLDNTGNRPSLINGQESTGEGNEQIGDGSGILTPGIESGPDNRLANAATKVIVEWRAGSLPKDEEVSDLANDIDGLANAWASALDGDRMPDKVGRASKVMADFLPLLMEHPINGDTCWPNARLSQNNLASVLFWLDLLSMSKIISLDTFDVGNQRLILEAALNPRKTSACAGKPANNQKLDLAGISQYLNQNYRHRTLARLVSRSVPQFEMDVSGVNLSGDRYLQIVAGKKLYEGASPSDASNILHIGELGVIVRQIGGIAVKIYDDQLSWLNEE